MVSAATGMTKKAQEDEEDITKEETRAWKEDEKEAK